MNLVSLLKCASMKLLTGIRQDVAVKLYGDDLDMLADKAEEIAGLISGIDGIAL